MPDIDHRHAGRPCGRDDGPDAADNPIAVLHVREDPDLNVVHEYGRAGRGAHLRDRLGHRDSIGLLHTERMAEWRRVRMPLTTERSVLVGLPNS